MHRLSNPVRPYAWGSPHLIPAFLGEEPDGSPVAEVWMGAHPLGPSTLADAEPLQEGGPAPTLDAVVAADPDGVLGEDCAARFGRLPFLVKLLAADAPLSLQLHPDAEGARAGFEREEREGLSRDDPARTFRDPWHKPELILALSTFHALCGVRDPDASLAGLDDLGPVTSPTLEAFREALRGEGGERGGARQAGEASDEARVRGALDVALSAGPAELAGACEELAALSTARADRGGSAPLAPAADAAGAATLQKAHPAAVGVLVSTLLHHVVLEPGQALFLGPRQLHAYRGGLALEVMASSDNVLRVGLTRKHVDTGAVLGMLDAGPVPVPTVASTATGRGVSTFAPPVEDFALDVLDVARLPAAVVPCAGSPRILVVLEGEVSLVRERTALDLCRGGAAFVPAGVDLLATSTGRGGRARLALARVGDAR